MKRVHPLMDNLFGPGRLRQGFLHSPICRAFQVLQYMLKYNSEKSCS